ncbi:pyrroline-5-carboxylate reductase 1 [Thalassobacillus devorans]|uniref:Pyrroline-5-carboxylate reductase n=1 Tax=Thalassobacillus devorans TaxID=279813 RepID=A0ABQ1PRT2_9BACI|nr:pyrroline-5-carboxylate reductase [Thalassobacillus devorans]GGD02053.1 pyrroline-5-carboxylate reductase 1 [Thalassobacillus devorans]
MFNKTIAFLGAGSMAEAMISGIVEADTIPVNQVIVTNRSNQDRLNHIQTKYGVRTTPLQQLNYNEVDIFILAMKPKDIDRVLESLKDKLTADQVLLSVLAGISTSHMEENMNDGQQVIRAMPNTSSMVGESATAISPGQYTGIDNVVAAKELLKCIGNVFVIDEKQMDIFTGIAGSGPAYFYYLMEHIEKAGQEGGLDRDTAREIGAQTILGAARMLQEQDDTSAELREKVTSPNGTTAAGLDALNEHGGGNAIAQAVKGAAARSNEMSKASRAKEKELVTK